MANFEVLTKLGKGSFGVVYKVRRKKDNKIYVLKQIAIGNMSKRFRQDAINEVSILARLKHTHIVKYYDSFITSSHLNIIMEYCENGDLNQTIKRTAGNINETKIWRYFL